VLQNPEPGDLVALIDQGGDHVQVPAALAAMANGCVSDAAYRIVPLTDGNKRPDSSIGPSSMCVLICQRRTSITS
jgi:hypothetical protein